MLFIKEHFKRYGIGSSVDFETVIQEELESGYIETFKEVTQFHYNLERVIKAVANALSEEQQEKVAIELGYVQHE